MDTRIFKALILILSFAVCFSASAQSSEQGSEPLTDEASKAYKEGTRLFSEEKYSDAALAFRRAYNLKPSWKILFNLAQSEAAAKRHGLALDAFEQYLSLGGDDISDDRRADVIAEIDNLAPVVGNLEIRCAEGLEVHVDGTLRGTTPLPGNLRVAAGVTHKVELQENGEVIHSRKVTVGGKQTVTMDMDEPEPKEPTPEESTPIPEKSTEEKSSLGTWGWVTAGTGGALLIGGAVTGAVALSKNKTLVDDCDNNTAGCDSSHRDSRDSMATTSTVLFGVGVAALAAGVTMIIVSKKKGEPEESTASSLRVLPAVGKRSGGLSLGGTF